MSVSVSVIYSLCKLKYYLQVNKTSFAGGEAWHCSSFSRNIFLISATDKNWIVLDGFVILLSFSSNACDLLEIEVSIVFYWVVLLRFFNILKKKKKAIQMSEFSHSKQRAVIYLVICLVQNSGCVKNAGEDRCSVPSLYMRFRRCFYELSASSVCLHWNTMQ